MSLPPVTHRLAEFIGSVSASALPDRVMHQAKRCLIDWLGVGIAGSREPSARVIQSTAIQLAPSPDAALLGSMRRVGAPFAALANGFAAHVLDYDDTYNPALTTFHGSSCIWPAVMAAAELTSIPGDLALAAFAAGFETAARVAVAAGPAHYEAGWHVTGTVGHLGAAAAVARVLQLEPAAIIAAIGAGGTQAAGLKAVYGTMGKALHPGKAAMDGVVAGVLAREGFESGWTIVEGRWGFLEVFTSNADPERALDGLGDAWLLCDDGFKAYASGSLTHPSIDCVVRLRADYCLHPDEIESIEARVHEYAVSTTGLAEPATGLEGKFSVHHCIAVAVVDGTARLAQFTDEKVRDPLVRSVRDRVRIRADAQRPKDSAMVTITLRDGRVLQRETAHNKGSRDNPMSDAEVEDKFLDLAGAVVGDAQVRRLAKTCWQVEYVDDVTQLMALTSRAEP